MSYRFKTRQEFENEFGEKWKSKVSWNNTGKMDYLFGIKLKVTFPDGFNQISIYDEYHNRNWIITRNMLTKCTPSYKPRKIIREI